MQKKEDLRIRKTKANLYKGLLQLMEEKTFEDIKVTDICNISLINRSTFYDHFNDKYELLAAFLEDLKKELIAHLEVKKEVTSIKEYYLELIKLLIDYTEKNINIYSSISIVKKNNNSIAYDMMLDAAEEAVTSHLKENYKNNSNVPIELISLFYVSGVIKICLEFLKEPTKYNHDELLSYIEKLIPDIDYLEPIK